MRILIILFLLVNTAQAQLKIAFMGDSHCNGGYGVGDSNWITRTSQFFADRVPGSTFVKYCAGGETIKTNMPLWYPGSVNGKSITNALNDTCDVFIFLQSGNHVAFDVPQDTSKFCYLKIADTLESLGKRWAFSTIGPRQNTYSGSMNFAKYNAQRDSLNMWLYATFPGHIFSLDTLKDVLTNKPKAYILLNDSLHYDGVGHRFMYQRTIRDLPFIDSLAGYAAIKGVNLKFHKDSVTFDGTDLKYLDVYGSNDGVVWSLVSHNELTHYKTFYANGYIYIRVRTYNNKKTITVSKKVQ